MKRRLSYIVGLVFLAAFSRTGWAIQNPVGSGTVPPTSRRSGLIRSPNPIDRSSNLVVTGNVGGGRYFRGVVPYNAVSDFGGRLGSSSLDSFLRRSAGGGYLDRYTGKPTPYYSQTRTVTTTRPGRSGVIGPPTTEVGGRAADRLALPPLPGERALSGSEAALSSRRLRGPYFAGPLVISRRMGVRPMSMTPQQLERVISSEVGTYLRDEKLTAERRRAQTEQFQRDLKQVKDKATELEKSLTGKDDSLRPSTIKKPGTDALQPFEKPRPKAQVGKEGPQAPFIEFDVPDKQIDVYEQMKRQLHGLRKGFVPSTVVEQAEEVAGGREEPGDEELQETSQADRLSEVGLSVARTKSILGPHKTFASFSKDRFNQHLRAAEYYLKRGRYYRAADAYMLASIYKPDDPLVYAGRSHALFAAGEYMSSALFLSRALEIFPEYARFKIDIEAMVGDKDKLESRVVDVEEWLERSGAAELQFLLAYVYYQMDRPEPAKEAIGAAYEKMPEAPAVITLKEAIETADSE